MNNSNSNNKKDNKNSKNKSICDKVKEKSKKTKKYITLLIIFVSIFFLMNIGILSFFGRFVIIGNVILFTPRQNYRNNKKNNLGLSSTFLIIYFVIYAIFLGLSIWSSIKLTESCKNDYKNQQI